MEPTRSSEWDATIAKLPGRTFFHSSAWARVLKGSYDYLPLYLVLSAGGATVGCLPLLEIDSWLTGRRGSSLPFTDECLPLAADQQTSRRLLEEALEIGRNRRWRFLFLQGDGGRATGPASPPPSYYTHEIDLQGTPQELFTRFTDAIRRGIRKAERSGVKVEVTSNADAVRAYYTLHCRTRKRHGLPPQPWRFFAQLHRHAIAVERGFVVLATLADRVIAGAVFLHESEHAIYKYGASDLAFQHVRPNNLAIWTAIQHLLGRGFKTLSLGRTSLSNDGLRRFKLGWGSAEQQLSYLKYEYGANDFVSGRDEAFGWHNAVFRHLPGFVSRFVGASLYRHWCLWVLQVASLGMLEISSGKTPV